MGGEVGDIVGVPVGGEVGSKNTTPAGLKRSVGLTNVRLIESLLVSIVGVLYIMQAECGKSGHGVPTAVGAESRV